MNCCCLVIGLFSTSEEVGDTLATDFILYGLEVMVCGLKRVRLHLTLSLTDVTQASCPIYLPVHVYVPYRYRYRSLVLALSVSGHCSTHKRSRMADEGG